VAVLCGLCTPGFSAGDPASRQLLNSWEVRDELKVAAGSETSVANYFPSFLEYQDTVMFHPKFGYYASGRVRFTVDYQTYPIALAPAFGQMIAEQIFKMWQGMRRAGTLDPKDRFTIAEFGAGNGAMAESILDYVEERSKEGGQGWGDFAAQVLYVCYDRSPALSETQRARNARFGKRFEARQADATDPVAAIKQGSLKGIVLSNELPDAFSVHKVILSADGGAEVAFVAPSIPQAVWAGLKEALPSSLSTAVVQGDRDIRSRFFSGRQNQIYLTKAAFLGLLEAMATSIEYDSLVLALQFNELYVPVYALPDLAAHLRRYASHYAAEIAGSQRGVVTYVNLGAEQFIQGAGRILGAGYVITLDYGSNWEGILASEAHPHLRTYGPARMALNQNADFAWGDGPPGGDQDAYDPYAGPTLNDMTTDLNFGLLAAAGELAGLKTLHYGPQSGLRTGTPISLLGEGGENLTDEFRHWAGSFETDGNYRLMVQQKNGTDPSYSYPKQVSEPLFADPGRWTEAHAQSVFGIMKRLIATTEQPAR
jgi:SAM-dependent MidA family methyltransferase